MRQLIQFDPGARPRRPRTDWQAVSTSLHDEYRTAISRWANERAELVKQRNVREIIIALLVVLWATWEVLR